MGCCFGPPGRPCCTCFGPGPCCGHCCGPPPPPRGPPGMYGPGFGGPGFGGPYGPRYGPPPRF